MTSQNPNSDIIVRVYGV